MRNVWMALCVGVVLVGCGPKDDLPAEATRTLSFDTLQVEDGTGVEVIHGGAYGYRVPGDGRVDVEVEDRIATVRRLRDSGDFAGGVKIYVEDLHEVRLSGKSVVHLDEVSALRFVARLSGQAELYLAGTAEQLEAHFTGNSLLDAAALDAKRALLRGSGNGHCEVYASESVDAHLTGNATCDVLGAPVDQDVVLEDEAGVMLR